MLLFSYRGLRPLRLIYNTVKIPTKTEELSHLVFFFKYFFFVILSGSSVTTQIPSMDKHAPKTNMYKFLRDDIGDRSK